MEKKYQVFVSSTYTDLQEERLAVFNALLDNDCIPVGMEQFPATSLSQWELIQKMINQCDYYLLIVAGRYGSIEKDTGISYTEKEFNYAKESKIPIMAFLHKNPQILPNNAMDDYDDGRKRLYAFRSKIENSGMHINYYEDKNDLKYKIAKSLSSITEDYPRVGWVRADKVEQILQSSEYVVELKELQKVVMGIKQTIDNKINAITPQWNEEKIRAIAEQVLEENMADEEEVKKMMDDIFKR